MKTLLIKRPKHTRINGKQPKNIVCQVTKKGCHECISHSKRDGYPLMKINNKSTTLSRWVYQTFKGKIPKKLVVRHTCDNTMCLNVNHLILGNQKENMIDMVIRNRDSGKLTIKQVKEIRKLLKTKIFQRDIAKLYNVSKGTISDINTGRTWKAI